MESGAFELFGAAHLGAIALTAALAVGAPRLVRRGSPRAARALRWGLAALLGGGTAAYLATEAVGSRLDRLDFLPLHLCDFAIFVALLALVTLRQRAAELLYFWSIGTWMAIATPDLQRGFADWYSWLYFVLHGAVVVAASTLVFGFGIRPERGAVWRSLWWTNAYAAVVAVANLLLGTDFLYLRGKPQGWSILDWLGPWPWYIAAVEFVAVVLFALADLPFARGCGSCGRAPPARPT